MSGPLHCWVYRSQRKSDTYLYLREEEGFGHLPAPLAEALGRLELVMELDLSPERRLAREEVTKVMHNLAVQGFHLQLPPQAGAKVIADYGMSG